MTVVGQIKEPPATDKRPSPSKVRHTKDIKILGLGRSENGEPYLKMRVKAGPSFLAPVNDFLDTSKDHFKRLQNRGANLMPLEARKELLQRVTDALGRKESFLVATRVGWHGDVFVFPKEIVPKGERAVEIYLQDEGYDVYKRFRLGGDRSGARELFALFRGNSRLMLGVSLAFVGPLGGVIPLVEHVGVQFLGPRGTGKSSSATALSCVWGWDPDPLHLCGFGASWKSTENALEKLARAYSNTLALLDETRTVPGANASAKANAVLNAIKDIASAQGKDRFDDPSVARWFTPLLSTSNTSVIEMLADAGLHGEASYYDRLFDVGPPDNIQPKVGDGFFEDLHGSDDKVKFRDRLLDLAKKHHGRAGRAFVYCLARALKKDRAELEAFVTARRDGYLREATKIPAPDRDPGRLHGKFATIYAAGCLAIRFGILPFKRAELLAAILTCERDHIALVEKELARFPAPGSPPLHRSRGATATSVQPAQSAIERLRAYLLENRKSLVDLRKPDAQLPPGHVHATATGYIGRFHFGMVAGFKSERWPGSNRNPRPDCVGIRTLLPRSAGRKAFSWRRALDGTTAFLSSPRRSFRKARGRLRSIFRMRDMTSTRGSGLAAIAAAPESCLRFFAATAG